MENRLPKIDWLALGVSLLLLASLSFSWRVGYSLCRKACVTHEQGRSSGSVERHASYPKVIQTK